MPCRTPRMLLAAAVASGLLLSALPVHATELADVSSGPVALVEDSPSKLHPIQAPTPAQYFDGDTPAQSTLSLSELKALGLPTAEYQVNRLHGTGNGSGITARSQNSEQADSFAYWENLSDEEDALLERIEQLWPQDSDDWDDQQWQEFLQTKEGQQLQTFLDELNEIFLSQLPEESRRLLEAMEALLPDGSDFWSEDRWEEFYQTEDGQEFLELLDQYYDGLFGDDEDSGFTDEEQEFWDSLEALLPEGFDSWDDHQWDEYYQTEEGQELLRLINEFYGSEVDEEEQLFWDTLEQMFPEGSEDWDDEVWDAYYGTDAGKELLSFVLTYELDHAEDELEVELLVEFYREILKNHSEWLEAFLADYFESSPAPTPSAPQEPTPQTPEPTPVSPEPNRESEDPDSGTPQETATPSEIVPVGQPDPSETSQPQDSAPPKDTNDPSQALAATGSQGLVAAGLGIVLVALGALGLRLRRKATHKA